MSDKQPLVTKVSDLTFTKLLDEVNPISSASKAVTKDDLHLIDLIDKKSSIEILFDRDPSKSPSISCDYNVNEGFSWTPKSNLTKFTCVLLGCHWLMYGCDVKQILKQSEESKMDTNDNDNDTSVATSGPLENTTTTIPILLQHVCEMIEKWFDEPSSNMIKEEMAPIWAMLEKLVLFDNFKFDSDNSDDASFISLRLALILFADLKIANQFSFANGIDSSSFKSKLDNSMFKEMVSQIGSFIDIYDTMTQSSVIASNTSNQANRGMIDMIVSFCVFVKKNKNMVCCGVVFCDFRNA